MLGVDRKLTLLITSVAKKIHFDDGRVKSGKEPRGEELRGGENSEKWMDVMIFKAFWGELIMRVLRDRKPEILSEG